MDRIGSAGVHPSEPKCAICSGLASAKGFCTPCKVACCGQRRLVHKECAKKVFTAINPGKIIVLDEMIKKILCSDCKVQCFFCNGKNHHYKIMEQWLVNVILQIVQNGVIILVVV